MAFPKVDPTTRIEWKNLQQHAQQETFHLRTLFQENPNRFKTFSIEHQGLLFDYSKNLITEETIQLLLKLATACDLSSAIKAYFQGETINETEQRAVLHTALRSSSKEPLLLHGKNIRKDISHVLERMKEFSSQVISGIHKGFSGENITDIVNIGIGGSDLGPVMVNHALKAYSTHLKIHFVSNIDGAHIEETLKNLNPHRTLFIIASKTFTTQETMTNAHTAKKWFLASGASQKDIAKHFVALSSHKEEVQKFGIAPQYMFEFWDWVGGRYSLWSAIGLSIILGIGIENFEKLLQGAENIDQHFKFAPFSENIPVIMAVLGIWYRNFLHAETHAILPYAQALDKFPEYLQQADMESNGKATNRNGKRISYHTGPIIWGRSGTNGQHAFYQLIHQGTSLISADFIGYITPTSSLHEHHQKLMANFFAQTQALAFGKTQEELRQEQENPILIPHKTFDGNRPTNTILFQELTPFSLGQLIALYEHKIFVQGVIWNIYSFDQFGVELGKALAHKILVELSNHDEISHHDSSTNGLINFFKSKKL